MVRKMPTTETELKNQLRETDSGMLNREVAEISVRKIDQDNRTAELSFSSEEPYGRWFGTEILDHSEGCVDLNRLNTIGCLLYNHHSDQVIGKIVSAKVENGRGVATVQFDKDEDSEKIYQKVLSGTLKGVSVGYEVSVWEKVEEGAKSSDGRFKGPCWIAKSWMPLEVSIVSVPADATVGVGRSIQTEEHRESLDSLRRQLQININNARLISRRNK